MNWFYAIFLGLIQGVTEFLPVSSSGHLSIFQNLFGLYNPEEINLLFDVMLHLGTLVAVFVAFWSDIVDILKELGRFIIHLFRRNEDPQPVTEGRRMILLLIVATLPLVAVIFFKDAVESLYANLTFVACALLVTGIVIFLSDRVKKGHKTAKSATVTDALLVGLAQMCAVVPGLSRSGMTISAGVARKFDRSFAVKFSFIMSIPAILAANILSLVDAVQVGIDWTLMPMYLVGMAVAAVSGYFSIKLVRLITEKNKFGKFAYYCLAVGLVVLVVSFFR